MRTFGFLAILEVFAVEWERKREKKEKERVCFFKRRSRSSGMSLRGGRRWKEEEEEEPESSKVSPSSQARVPCGHGKRGRVPALFGWGSQSTGIARRARHSPRTLFNSHWIEALESACELLQVSGPISRRELRCEGGHGFFPADRARRIGRLLYAINGRTGSTALSSLMLFPRQRSDRAHQNVTHCKSKFGN